MGHVYRVRRDKPDGSVEYSTGGTYQFSSEAHAKIWTKPGYVKLHLKQYESKPGYQSEHITNLLATNASALLNQLTIEQLETKIINTFSVEEIKSYHE